MISKILNMIVVFVLICSAGIAAQIVLNTFSGSGTHEDARVVWNQNAVDTNTMFSEVYSVIDTAPTSSPTRVHIILSLDCINESCTAPGGCVCYE